MLWPKKKQKYNIDMKHIHRPHLSVFTLVLAVVIITTIVL